MKQRTNEQKPESEPAPEKRQPAARRASATSIVNPANGPRRSRIKPKWSGYYQTLLRIRELLLRERGEKLGQASEPVERLGTHQADSATDEFDRDMVLSQVSKDQDLLFEVEAALRRIADGTYGRCEESGQPIPPERLRVMPWTRFARDVEEKLEQLGEVKEQSLGQVGHVWSQANDQWLENETGEEKAQPQDELLRIERTYSLPHRRRLKRSWQTTPRKPKPKDKGKD